MIFAEDQVKRATFLLSSGRGASCGSTELSGVGKLLQLQLQKKGKEGKEKGKEGKGRKTRRCGLA